MSAVAARCGAWRFAQTGRSLLTRLHDGMEGLACLSALVHAFRRVTLAVYLVIVCALTAFAQGGSDAPTIPGMPPWLVAAHNIVHPWPTICLLVAGCCLLFHDMLTPKTWGITGNLGTLCVGLVFAANIAVGQAGWVGVLLLLLGLVAVLLEVHVYPGHGSALIGFILMFAGMFQSLGGTKNAPFALGATFVLLLVFGLAFLTYLPQSPAWRAVRQKIQERQTVLSAQAFPSNVLTPEELKYFGGSILVGQRGTVVSALRPTGTANFGGVLRRVVTEGDFLEVGQEVVIARVEGERIVVDPAGVSAALS